MSYAPHTALYPCIAERDQRQKAGRRDLAKFVRIAMLRSDALGEAGYQSLHPPAALVTLTNFASQNIGGFKLDLPTAARFFANGLRAVAEELGTDAISLLKEIAA